MLDERAMRSPEWKPGNEVKLADGQTWTVPIPRIRFRPKFVDGIAIVKADVFGPEIDPLFDIICGIVDVDTMVWLGVRFDVVSRLLRMNYRLSDDELSDLLVMDPDDEVNKLMWEDLTKVAMGESVKKATPTTSEPAA